MHYQTTIELKGLFKDVFEQAFEDIDLQIKEMPAARQDVVIDIKKHLELDDGTLLLNLVGTNRQEKPLVVDILMVSLNGAKEMAKVGEDSHELARVEKYEQTLMLYKNTGIWNTSIVDSPNEDTDFDEEA